jgi:hypothetical protein
LRNRRGRGDLQPPNRQDIAILCCNPRAGDGQWFTGDFQMKRIGVDYFGFVQHQSDMTAPADDVAPL